MKILEGNEYPIDLTLALLRYGEAMLALVSDGDRGIYPPKRHALLDIIRPPWLN